MLRLDGGRLLCRQRGQGRLPLDSLLLTKGQLQTCYAPDSSPVYRQQAIRMSKPTEVQEGVFVSTIVEDVPMILNRSIKRATETLRSEEPP